MQTALYNYGLWQVPVSLFPVDYDVCHVCQREMVTSGVL